MQAQDNLAIGEHLPPPAALFQMASSYWVSQGDLCRRTPRDRRSPEGWTDVIPRAGRSYGKPSGFASSAPAGARERRCVGHRTELLIRAYSHWSFSPEQRPRFHTLDDPHLRRGTLPRLGRAVARYSQW